MGALPGLPGCCLVGWGEGKGRILLCKLRPRGQGPSNCSTRACLGRGRTHHSLLSVGTGLGGPFSSDIRQPCPSCANLSPPPHCRLSSGCKVLLCAWDPEVLSRRLCKLTSPGAREAHTGAVGAGLAPPPPPPLGFGSCCSRTSSWVTLRRTTQLTGLELSVYHRRKMKV